MFSIMREIPHNYGYQYIHRPFFNKKYEMLICHPKCFQNILKRI
jgi:hypothetical protein